MLRKQNKDAEWWKIILQILFEQIFSKPYCSIRQFYKKKESFDKRIPWVFIKDFKNKIDVTRDMHIRNI